MAYNSINYLTALQKTLLKYIPSMLPDDIKAKRFKVLEVACNKKCKHDSDMDLYDLQLEASNSIDRIVESQILGCNEIVIPHFVAEYGDLKDTLELLNKEQQSLKQFQELQPFLTAFKLKEISSLLYDDLTQLVEEYNIEGIDVKELVKSI